MKRAKITKPSKHTRWSILISFESKQPTTQDNIEQSVLRALQTDRFGFEGVATVTARSYEDDGRPFEGEAAVGAKPLTPDKSADDAFRRAFNEEHTTGTTIVAAVGKKTQRALSSGDIAGLTPAGGAYAKYVTDVHQAKPTADNDD